MKKFAFAAIALLGTFLVISVSPSVAKPGGFKGGFKGKFFADKHFVKGHHYRFAHHRFRHRNVIYGWGYGGAAIAAPIVYGQPYDPVTTGSVPAPVAEPVWRTVAESQQSCSIQHVTVPSERGGETTVNVIRC